MSAERMIMPEPDRLRVNNRTVVLVAGTGMFLSTLDTGIISVALPSLGSQFHTGVATISWAVTLYLMALVAAILPLGRLGDRHGHLVVFAAGLLVFAVGSILCGAAQSAGFLIGSRGLQGLGAAMLQATAAALITTRVPAERRGATLGSLGLIMGLGPVLGPAVGGGLLSTIGWRWIFWINLPICLAGLWGCRRLGPRRDHPEQKASDDSGGRWLSLGFVIPVLATASMGAATAIVFIAPPYFLEGILRLPPWRVGFVSLAAPLGLAVLAQISGRLLGRLGSYVLMIAGLSLMTAAPLLLSLARPDWPVALFTALLFLYGVGAGLFVPADLAAVMAAVGADRQGTAGAVQRMVQNIGIAAGTVLTARLLQGRITSAHPHLAGFQVAWLVCAAVVAAGLAASLIMWRRT